MLCVKPKSYTAAKANIEWILYVDECEPYGCRPHTTTHGARKHLAEFRLRISLVRFSHRLTSIYLARFFAITMNGSERIILMNYRRGMCHISKERGDQLPMKDTKTTHPKRMTISWGVKNGIKTWMRCGDWGSLIKRKWSGFNLSMLVCERSNTENQFGLTHVCTLCACVCVCAWLLEISCPFICYSH